VGGLVRPENRPAETFVECLRCPVRCPDTKTYEAHLVDRHMYSPAVAQAIARGLYLTCCDRIGPEHAPTCHPRSRPATMREPAADPAAPAPTPPAPEETPMAKRIDPAACKVCARLTKKAGAPTKCKRHGGAGRPSTRSGGTSARAGSKKPAPAPARAASKRGGGLDAKAEAMLTATKARVQEPGPRWSSKSGSSRS
jgi:hypothetical protein